MYQIYGGVLSLFVKFSRSKKTSSLNFTNLRGGEEISKNWKIEKLRKTYVEKIAPKICRKIGTKALR